MRVQAGMMSLVRWRGVLAVRDGVDKPSCLIGATMGRDRWQALAAADSFGRGQSDVDAMSVREAFACGSGARLHHLAQLAFTFS